MRDDDPLEGRPRGEGRMRADAGWAWMGGTGRDRQAEKTSCTGFGEEMHMSYRTHMV